MSAFESSYKSLLQGVSQQVPRERLDGQVTALDNMLCDAVTNLRRRPGVEYAYDMTWPGVSPNTVRSWNTDIGGFKVDVLLNTSNGEIAIRNEGGALVATLPNNPYLVASDRKVIQATTVGDQFVLCNTDKMPTAIMTQTEINPNSRGFFFIRAGAFNYTYQITAKDVIKSSSVSFLTPDGSELTHAAQATPQYIAEQLANSLTTAGFVVSRDGAFVYVDGATELSITSSSAILYVATSNTQYVTDVSYLPSRLPVGANGMIIAVGSKRAPVYYQYNYNQVAWLESAQWGSPTGLLDMPVAISWNGTAWGYDGTAYEGRLSGDDVSNPLPNFLTRGITGIGAFQGRLVILSGSLVNLSASRKLHRWFRSTVVEVIDSDPIEVGASANSSAAYVYAVPFQKDLLLFSEKYQALIPSGSAALTPRNASVVVTSTHEADVSCPPLGLGRTLMFPKPRNRDFYGMMEMVPSTNTDSQYVSDDATPHLPSYLAGRCRFAVASSVANIVILGSTADPRVVYVHEYLWSEGAKAQQAWHRWTFPFDIADAYFVGEKVYFLFVANNKLVACTLDPRGQGKMASGATRPFLDMYSEIDVVDNLAPIPAWLRALDPDVPEYVKVAQSFGGTAGEEVESTPGLTGSFQIITGESFPSGDATIGVPYESLLVPTPPMRKDQNGVVISSNKMTVLRFMIGTAKSSEYEVAVRDSASPDYEEIQEVGSLFWNSAELQLGQARNNGEAVAVVPARTNAATTELTISTGKLGELNVISLEYTARWHAKLRRV